MISCSVQLINNTDNQVAFRLLTNTPEYFLEPLCGVVLSGDSYTLTLTRPKLLNPPANRDKYFTLECSTASSQELQCAISDAENSYSRFFIAAKENDRELQQVKLAAVYEPPVAGKAITKDSSSRQKYTRLCKNVRSILCNSWDCPSFSIQCHPQSLGHLIKQPRRSPCMTWYMTW
ncbi:unnamed protein product, partial [Urochloa humidicola]